MIKMLLVTFLGSFAAIALFVTLLSIYNNPKS